MKLSETAQFRMGARTVYECNGNSILDTCHHSYIIFGRGSAVKAVMLKPRCLVTAVARKAKCYSQQTQVLAGARRSLTCFKFRILRGPLFAQFGPTGHIWGWQGCRFFPGVRNLVAYFRKSFSNILFQNYALCCMFLEHPGNSWLPHPRK